MKCELIHDDTLQLSGTIRDFTALDVVPREMGPMEKSTFFSQLRANVHNHKTTEDGDGWIIIDIEEAGLIPMNTFVATYNQVLSVKFRGVEQFPSKQPRT